MKTIWKHQLKLTDRQTLSVPTGAIFLCVQNQNGIPTIWSLVEPDAPTLTRRYIEIIGTGHEIAEAPRVYIGTVQIDQFVWHIFERTGQ